MAFRQEVYAKYTVVEADIMVEADMAKIKSFAKKAIIPLLLALGPVACGTQPDGGGDKSPNTQMSQEQERDSGDVTKIQTQMNKNLDSQGIHCKVVVDNSDNKGHWTFVDDEGSSVVLTISYDESGKAQKDTVEITKKPSSEKMTNFADAVMTTFQGQDPGHVSDMYNCDLTSKNTTRSVPSTSPNIP